ncbi:MAG TPA: hypothetical protein PLX90_05735, partial [Anaerolineales bacterium]|nr:hypothetical protein [Anaerolineales bacterium]
GSAVPGAGNSAGGGSAVAVADGGTTGGVFVQPESNSTKARVKKRYSLGGIGNIIDYHRHFAVGLFNV